MSTDSPPLNPRNSQVPFCARSQEGEELYTRAVELDWSKQEQPGGAFWFDYLADTGDGQMALYDIAYL